MGHRVVAQRLDSRYSGGPDHTGWKRLAHATFVESFILVKTPAGWKIVFHHTSQLPPDFGVD